MSTVYGQNDASTDLVCGGACPRQKPTRNIEILSKIFHQIQKTVCAAEQSSTRKGRQLSKLYLINWSLVAFPN